MENGDDLRISANESDERNEVLSDRSHCCNLRGAIMRMSVSKQRNGRMEE